MTSYTVHSPTSGPGQIHDAMTAILDEMPAIGKDSRNPSLNFSFRSIDAIVDAANPLLGKHGVVPVLHASQLLHWEPKTKGHAAVILNTYRFTARDGSWVEAQGIGEGHDFGDKAVSKANTMAYKTCLGQTFCLAYENDPDGDSVEANAQTQAPVAEQAPPATALAPPPPDDPLEKARAELWSKVERLSVAEKDKLKEYLLGKDGPGHSDFDTFTVEQIPAIDKWVDDEFGEPF